VASARPIVNPPAFTPLPHGLWDVAQHPTPPDHWQQGVTWIDRCPVGNTTYDECLLVTGSDGGPPPAPPAKEETLVQVFRGATPFTVFSEFDCSLVGLNDAATVAEEALSRIEYSRIEQAFWTGVAGGQTVVFPHLAADTEVEDEHGILLQPAAVIAAEGTDAVTLDPAVAFGQLEHQLDQCMGGGEGVIHVPRLALPTLISLRVVSVDSDGKLRTASGNLVVVTGDYPGTRPNGAPAADATSWVYATGPVFAYRSEMFVTTVPDSFDRAENTVKMIAERTYVIGFSCCLLAALMDLGVPTV
jgi:hypothetical protein